MGAPARNSSKSAFIIRILIESLRCKSDPRVTAIRRLLEAGFTGMRVDKRGAKRYYRDGRQVANPTPAEKKALASRGQRALPSHQRISHDEAKQRIGAIGPNTHPDQIKALANDLMNMSYADLVRIKQDLGASGGWGSKAKMTDRLQQGVTRNELPTAKRNGLQAVRVKRSADGKGIEVDPTGESNRIAWQTPDGKLHSTAIGAYGHLKQNQHLLEPKATQSVDPQALQDALKIHLKSFQIADSKVDQSHNRGNLASSVQFRNDVIGAFAKKLGIDSEQAKDLLVAAAKGKTPAQLQEPEQSSAAPAHKPLFDGDTTPRLTVDDIEKGNWDTIHPGLGSEIVMSRLAQGMKGINNQEYGIYQHQSGKYLMVSRPDRTSAGKKPASQPQEPSPAKPELTRAKPRSLITFGKPITGPSGATIGSYQWQHKTIDDEDKRDGEAAKRVSDWTKAINNVETSREIVHHFKVTLPDGSSKVVSLESALKLLGYQPGDAGAAKIRNMASGARALAVAQMQLAIAQQAAQNNERIKAEVAKMEPPKMTVEKGMFLGSPSQTHDTYRMGNTTISRFIKDPLPEDTIQRDLTDSWRKKQVIAAGGDPYDLHKVQAQSLRERVKSLEKKVQASATTAYNQPNPEEDSEKAAPAPADQGFTGIDAEGREWRNGELVAKTPDEPAKDEQAQQEPKPSGEAPAPSPEPDTATAPSAPEKTPRPKRQRKSRAKMTILGIVAKQGGITPQSVKAMANYKEQVIQGGLLHAIRSNGIDIGKMAETLERQGHFRTPPDRHADDYMLELMANGTVSQLAEEKNHFDKEQEEYYKALEAAKGEHNERDIEAARERGEETGRKEGEDSGVSEVSGWDQPDAQGAGADEEDYDRSEPASGAVDASFDFGANAEEPQQPEPPPEAAKQSGERKITSYAGKNGDVIQVPGGYIDIHFQNNPQSPRRHSVVGFLVDEDKRGQGIGHKLLQQAKQKYSDLGAQVSSKASLKVFYNNGFRAPEMPEASFPELLKLWKENGESLYMAVNDEDGRPYADDSNPKQSSEPASPDLPSEQKEQYEQIVADIESQLDPEKNNLSRFSQDQINRVINRLNDYRAKLGLSPRPLLGTPSAANEPAAPPAADQPGFTGTDAQGREWRNGELVAKQEEPKAASAKEVEAIENKKWDFTEAKKIGAVTVFSTASYKSNPADSTSAAQAAGFYAKKYNKPFQVVPGNSYMNKVFSIAQADTDEIGRNLLGPKANIMLVFPNGNVYQTLAVKKNPKQAPVADLFGNPLPDNKPKSPETMPGLFGEPVPIGADKPQSAPEPTTAGTDNPLDRPDAAKKDDTQDMFGLFGPGARQAASQPESSDEENLNPKYYEKNADIPQFVKDAGWDTVAKLKSRGISTNLIRRLENHADTIIRGVATYLDSPKAELEELKKRLVHQVAVAGGMDSALSNLQWQYERKSKENHWAPSTGPGLAKISRSIGELRDELKKSSSPTPPPPAPPAIPKAPPMPEPAPEPAANEHFSIAPNGKGFSQAVALLKKRGGKFNPTTKSWELPPGKISDYDASLFGLKRHAFKPQPTRDDENFGPEDISFTEKTGRTPTPPPAAENSEKQEQFRVYGSGANYKQGLDMLKNLGGKFNPETKTWTLPPESITDSVRSMFGLKEKEGEEYRSDGKSFGWSFTPHPLPEFLQKQQKEAVMPTDKAAKIALVQAIISQTGAKPPRPKQAQEAQCEEDPRVKRIRELLASKR